jgi:predicted bacteriocin transport accessory protein
MKKSLLLILISLIFLSGCSSIPASVKDKAPSMTKITQVLPSYVVELIESNESFIFYFGNSWCSACQFVEAVNNEVVSREKIPMYYIEMDKTTTKQLNMIYQYVIKPVATPTYIIVLNGVVIESFYPEVFVGDDTSLDENHISLYADNLIALLKTKGLIN